MPRRWTLLATFALLLFATDGAGATGPELETDAAERDRAVRCPISFSGDHEPVLLVHGTAGRPEDHWALGYQKILPDLGYLFADGKNVNVERVRRGWSRFDTRWGEGRFAPAFRAAEREAERAERL